MSIEDTPDNYFVQIYFKLSSFERKKINSLLSGEQLKYLNSLKKDFNAEGQSSLKAKSSFVSSNQEDSPKKYSKWLEKCILASGNSSIKNVKMTVKTKKALNAIVSSKLRCGEGESSGEKLRASDLPEDLDSFELSHFEAAE